MNRLLLTFIFLAGIIAAETNGRTLSDPTTRKNFESKRAEINNPEAYSIFKTDLTAEQREALEFLYAYMPLADIVDKSGEYHLSNVNAAFKAIDEMPWGKSVPDREFRHFVLPQRVNNEQLDSCRSIFYNELKERVKGLSMEEAILEVNHWCHEKATYQPSDSRTSSPLSTVSQAIGRCGEESTFTVAALRSVGIPARQVYTPRWAHTDDNHAWVEAWANGKWHFLGACEPEAILDLGWFNSPASRGMLMTTRVFGEYDGPEEVVSRVPGYSTTINATSIYAPTNKLEVEVVDNDGNPVPDAEVRFSIYNYAEYYPVAVKPTDKNGIASLTTGCGDLVIAVNKDGRFGLSKATVGKDKRVRVSMPYDNTSNDIIEWTLTPPPAGAELPVPTPEQAIANEQRKQYEDSLRTAYTLTFYNPESAKQFAIENGFDTARIVPLLIKSRGNGKIISDLLVSLPAERRDKALNLLEVISEKDLRDIPVDVIIDHLNTPDTDSPLFNEYVMNPRVTNESLTPYKSLISNLLGEEILTGFRADPNKLIKWIVDTVAIDDSLNPVNFKISPISTIKTRKADRLSRDVMFVALARTAGIPSRIDPVTGKTQYADGQNNWIDVDFGAEVETTGSPKGLLQLTYTPVGRITDPIYNTHFSISKIENGVARLQEYPELGRFSEIFTDPVEVDAGQYLLTTGQRMADGSVLARSTIFNVADGETSKVPLVMLQDTTSVQVLGAFNSENQYTPIDGEYRSLLSTSGRGYYILGMLAPGHEPSTHALNDLQTSKKELEEWGKTIFLIFPDRESFDKFHPSDYPGLPSNIVFGVDTTGSIAKEIPEKDMPSFIIADTFNRIVFISSGYTINLGDRIVDILHKLKE